MEAISCIYSNECVLYKVPAVNQVLLNCTLHCPQVIFADNIAKYQNIDLCVTLYTIANTRKDYTGKLCLLV